MNAKKVILAGLVVDILSFVVAVPSYHLFGSVFELEPASIWKWTPQMPLGSISAGWLIFIVTVNTALAIFFAFLYALLFRAIPGTGIRKGLMFALLLYPVGVLVPVFSIYVLVNIAAGAAVYFTLQGLVEFLIYGAAVALVYKEKARTPFQNPVEWDPSLSSP
jgi:hypothetical protein